MHSCEYHSWRKTTRTAARQALNLLSMNRSTCCTEWGSKLGSLLKSWLRQAALYPVIWAGRLWAGDHHFEQGWIKSILNCWNEGMRASNLDNIYDDYQRAMLHFYPGDKLSIPLVLELDVLPKPKQPSCILLKYAFSVPSAFWIQCLNRVDLWWMFQIQMQY